MGAPTSSLIVGSRIVTAEVFALTTKVDTHAAARTPPAAFRPVSSPTLTSRHGGYRRCRRVIAEEEIDDQAADERCGDPGDLQRQLERVVEYALAERRRAGLVGLGGSYLRSVGGEEEHACDGGPERDHVAGADPERKPQG